METPTPPPRRCLPCGKHIFATHAEALEVALRLRVDSNLYRDEYRCPGDAAGGWHLRDLLKRYEKIKNHDGVEARALREKLARLDLIASGDARRAARKPRKQQPRDPVDTAITRISPGKVKPVGRRGQLQRIRHKHDHDEHDLGTRGTSVANELRRRQERAKLREELLREEKET